MATPLKDLYSLELYQTLTQYLSKLLPSLDRQAFLDHIFAEGWEQKELKERMRHTTEVLRTVLPKDFAQSSKMLLKLIEQLRTNSVREQSVEYMFFPDFIELYGMDDLPTSIRAMEQITQFTSCEFAVRPFIIRYQEEMTEQMLRWSKHENHHVRRLASEGIRPRLPWAMTLPAFKANPAPILPILENLTSDPSEYVRRSVANNLNDISKDHPEVVLEVVSRWKGLSPETDKLIKHACRTLLKAGNPEALNLFGLGYNEGIQMQGFQIDQETISFPGDLHFSFHLSNQNSHAQIIRLEYAIHFQKANGTLSKKVFKISEKTYAPGEQTQVSRTHRFKPITTRVYHPGLHRVSVILNGKEFEALDFQLSL